MNTYSATIATNLLPLVLVLILAVAVAIALALVRVLMLKLAPILVIVPDLKGLE
jgi:hypothetical protein